MSPAGRSTSNATPPPTRRAQHRAATIEEIKQAALDSIATEGAGSLTIRGIARSIGMSPAGLYRYVDGLDDLITHLLADACNDHTDAVLAASAGADLSTVGRLRAAIHAYRRWALDNRNRFLLIFGTPIPGYTPSQQGPAAEAAHRMTQVFLAIVVEGTRSGALVPPRSTRIAEPGEVALVNTVAPGFPPEAVGPFLGTWAHVHGMVTLEVLHHLDEVYPDPETFFRAEVERLIAAWLPAAAITRISDDPVAHHPPRADHPRSSGAGESPDAEA